jgi:GDP-L-fucose synthase
MQTSLVLVTGGSGLVGNAIKSISGSYPQYTFVYPSSKEFNLMSLEETRKMFKTYSPDYVIHLAACVGGLFKNLADNVGMYEKNLQINYNVVKCSHDFKVKKFIGCLSTCIFPDNTTYPITENMLHNGMPHNSNFGYSYAKRMLEVQCKAYREQYGDNMICVVPTNIYGEHDNFNLNDAHVIPALIHKCYIAKQQNTNFVVSGDGSPLRQFLYSKDLARLLIIILEKYEQNDNIILSVNEEQEVSIKEIAQIINKKLNCDKLSFDNDINKNGQYKKTASNTKLINFLNDNNITFNFTSLENGLDKTIDWFLENYDNIRK